MYSPVRWTIDVVGPDLARTHRNARVAVAALFFANGAIFSTVVPRYPEIKADLGLSNAALGSALAAFPAGALVAGLSAAALIGRYRSARVAAYGIAALATAVALLAVANTWAALAAIMFVAGAIDAVVDVAQNAHGLRVQRRYGRSIVNAFHGVWSIGAVTGGLAGSAAAGLDIALEAHLIAVSALFALVAVVAHSALLTGADVDDRVATSPAALSSERRAPRAARRALVILGVLAACGAVAEDAAASWGALYLRANVGTTAATAGLAFVFFQSAMTAGRLLGDRAVNRFGASAVVRSGGGLAAAAMAVALAVPATSTTLLGFGLVGLGVATLVPSAMHHADELPGLPPGVGLAAVSWMLRVGFVLSPPLVGVVADASSLRVGLLGVVAAGALVAIIGRVLRNDQLGGSSARS
jgi:fucose permease